MIQQREGEIAEAMSLSGQKETGTEVKLLQAQHIDNPESWEMLDMGPHAVMCYKGDRESHICAPYTLPFMLHLDFHMNVWITGLRCLVEEKWIVLRGNGFPDSVEVFDNLLHMASFVANLDREFFFQVGISK